MPLVPPAWRSFGPTAVVPGLRRALLGALLLVVLIALPSMAAVVMHPAAALAAAGGAPAHYRCDGDPLEVLLVRGAVDDPAIPDPSAASVPVGGFAVLRWRELSLQLPRTNNAGPASFTDGRWWWSLEDPTHPRFRLRRALGDVQDFRCEPA